MTVRSMDGLGVAQASTLLEHLIQVDEPMAHASRTS